MRVLAVLTIAFLFYAAAGVLGLGFEPQGEKKSLDAIKGIPLIF